MTNSLFSRPLRVSHSLHRALELRRCMGTQYQPRTNATSGSYLDKNEFNRLFVEGGAVEVQPGDHVLAACREHKIYLPTTLRRSKEKKGLKDFMIFTSERHCFDQQVMKYLDKFEHPFAKSIINMCVDKNHEPLWYKTFTLPVASPFPCGTATRKMRHALRDALAAAGYDRVGRKISPPTDPNGIAELYGTLRVGISDPKGFCNLKFVDMLAKAKLIISEFEPIFARDKFGRHINMVPKPSPLTRRPSYNKNTNTNSIFNTTRNNSSNNNSNNNNNNRNSNSKPGLVRWF